MAPLETALGRPKIGGRRRSSRIIGTRGYRRCRQRRSRCRQAHRAPLRPTLDRMFVRPARRADAWSGHQASRPRWRKEMTPDYRDRRSDHTNQIGGRTVLLIGGAVFAGGLMEGAALAQTGSSPTLAALYPTPAAP